tara:strand:+ start:1768 stop:2280 length:513 start_codon:yes stop_codon:yes gene_type:complete
MKYNKIFILGGIGSGKTTLANKLSKILKIKNFELDDIAYKKREAYEKQNPKARDKKLKVILKRKKWIIEGFYSRPWIHPIYKKADIIIILNIELSISKRRIIKRFLKRKLSFKKEKRFNEKLKSNLNLLKSTGEYPKYFKIQKETAKRFNKNTLILKNNKEINDFIKNLK